MKKRRFAIPFVVALVAAMVASGGTAAADPDHDDGVGDGGQQGQHGAPGGHLAGSSSNVTLVGRVDASGAVGVDRPGHIADVASHRNHAYLAARRLNTNPCGTGGFYTVDISNPASPTEVSFTAFPAGTYPGEGMHVIEVNTPAFKGDVLVTNNEQCLASGKGGISLYDVTDPTAITALAVGFGDLVPSSAPGRAHSYHSAFGWQDNKRAFVIASDNEEQGSFDVEIIEITDPTNPVLIRETGLPDWPTATVFGNGNTVFNHDMVVKKIGGHMYGLLSYWDVGWVTINLDDPANPVFIGDSNHPSPEPLLGFAPPEGNAHQAEWSHNSKYILGTDEDFSPTRTQFTITSGPDAGGYGGGTFGWSDLVPLGGAPVGTFQGSTAWGGTGCVEDLNGNSISDRLEVPTKAATGADVIVFTRGTCFFSIKVESGQLAGYDKVIVMQSHAGSRFGLLPDSFFCGGQGSPIAVGTTSAICIGHESGHLLFNDTPTYTGPDGGDMPALGTVGASVHATAAFDGWGAVHLLNADTLTQVDEYAVAESLDSDFATGFGNLSAHEVAMDKANDIAYLSYYSAGIRVVKFGPTGIQEVGHYVDAGGNDFWGVQAHRLPADATETTYILGSDRSSGLWIFRYTGG